MTAPATLALDAGTTASKAWAELSRVFREAGLESPVIDSRLLVCHALGIDRLGLLREPYQPLGVHAEILLAAARRRLAREPVSRIAGERYFWGRPFKITPATLDPRADSETLVAVALELAPRIQSVRGMAPLRLLDLGTGTGCLLLTLLAELPEAVGTGIDVSADALAVARENAASLGLDARAEFAAGDWCTGLVGPFDIIVSNPPYIRHADLAGLPPDVRNYDPVLALDGGTDGLHAYRQILANLPPLRPDGALLFEVGLGQDLAVRELLAQTPGLADAQGAALEGMTHSWQDLSGVERVVGVGPAT